jgi:aerobic-type carbon monoxide dehydrogenase small subunit (CoxS/CutS family)
MSMAQTETVTLRVNGAEVSVARGTTVAAMLFDVGAARFRRSVTGEPRSALCGMGICFECRVTIDGRAHARSCQILCSDGMSVRTDD